MEPRKLVVSLLLLAIAAPVLPAEQTPQEKANRIRRGSRVEVKLKTIGIVRGRLEEVTDAQFSLGPLRPGSAPRSQFLFQDVTEIRSIEPPLWLKTLRAPVVIPLKALEITGLFIWCSLGGCLLYGFGD